MNCIVCHGIEIEVREVGEEIRLREDIVCLDLRLPVCLSCGERYYDPETMRHLWEVGTRVKEGNAQLQQIGPVLRYS